MTKEALQQDARRAFSSPSPKSTSEEVIVEEESGRLVSEESRQPLTSVVEGLALTAAVRNAKRSKTESKLEVTPADDSAA